MSCTQTRTQPNTRIQWWIDVYTDQLTYTHTHTYYTLLIHSTKTTIKNNELAFRNYDSCHFYVFQTQNISIHSFDQQINFSNSILTRNSFFTLSIFIYTMPIDFCSLQLIWSPNIHMWHFGKPNAIHSTFTHFERVCVFCSNGKKRKCIESTGRSPSDG